MERGVGERVGLDNSHFSVYEKYCSGYLDNPNGNYAVLPNLSVASIQKNKHPKALEKIIAFDAAEISTANLGKINALSVSSFISPNGRLAGYDFLKKEDMQIGEIGEVKIFKLEPIISVASQIVGVAGNPKYPIFPGSMVPCAMKTINSDKQGDKIYAGLSISVPKDRAKNPFLLMEDVGHVNNIDSEYFYKAAKSALEVANAQGIEVERIYIAKKEIEIGKNEIGTAMVICPYVHLPLKLKEELTTKWE